MDLTMRDPETNAPWDLRKKSVQKHVSKMVSDSKLFMLLESPPCTPFSWIQGLSADNRDPQVVAAEQAAGRADMKFCFEMYEVQRNNGRVFAHEHPSTSTSWSMPELLEMLLKEEVGLVEFDMCDFGMKSKDAQREGLICK